MRTILLMFILLGLFFVSMVAIGYKWTILIASVGLAIKATVFLIKKEYYFKYVEFVNPNFNKLFEEKDSEFKRKNRMTNIVCWYFLSFVFFLQGMMMPNDFVPFEGITYKGIFMLAVIIMGILPLLLFANNYIFKKSKDNGEFVAYSLALGVIAAVVLIGVMVFYIFSKIG